MTTILRRLASSECGFVGPAPTTCAFELTLRGALDLTALNDAFAQLRTTHPALDAAVVDDADGYAFVARGNSSAAAFTIDRVDALPDEYPPLVIDPTVALGRLHVESAGDRHRVTLGANHALADGTYLLALVAELWSRYSALLRDDAVAAAPHDFPDSAQHALNTARTGSDTGRERLADIRWYGAAPTGVTPGARLPEVASLLFSPEVTARFAAAAAGIGFNALLSGVLLCAERAGFVDDAPDEAIKVGAMTLVDLRHRVRPALAATDVTNFVGASFAAPELTIAADPVHIGAAIADTVRADLAAGLCLNVLSAAAPPGPGEPPVVLSNLGSIALDLPEELVGERLRPVMSMDSTLLHVPPGPRLPSPSATIFQACTFGGRLGIEAITLGGSASPVARAAVTERIGTLVNAAAQLAPVA
ncbi:hypothetical protein GOEFS_021_00120 [Gordonia effusa NBRC 100432]|uniref:Phthiocerol/phthiodiolone dimycocerosyl transferase n=1 Tax=Gordonia effusa NBRC 100432 TaxID=1077974 RepID=H0QWI4_9ACTN|nr:hypothetical protein [Gordonia effusa]GAB17185.1 hypothetical protein GOEFS_021_00120 [Gordonia effusa NBRC 100432]